MTKGRKKAVKKDETNVVVNEDIRIRELEEKLTELSKVNQLIMEQNTNLMGALVAERNKPDILEDEETCVVENVCGSFVSLALINEEGEEERVYLPSKGDKARVRVSQFQDLAARYPDFINEGYISCDILPENPNIIKDHKQFIEQLASDKVDEAIDAITSVPTLYVLFNIIENARFGDSYVDTDGELKLRELTLAPNYQLVGRAVKRRLAALTSKEGHGGIVLGEQNG